MTAETQAFWDAQLENSVVVPGAAEWPERYLALSAAHGRLADAERMATGPDESQALWRTPTGAADKALVFIHGGYWRKYSAPDLAFVAATAEAAGVTFYNVDYRLMPGVRMADLVADTVAACAMALEAVPNAVLVGHSAGAHLAVEVALRMARPPRAVVAMSGLYELAPLRHAFIQDELSLTLDEVEAFSPQSRVASVPCPVHVQVGGEEKNEFLRQSVRFAEALTDAGREATLWFAPNLNHFEIVAELADPNSETARRIINIIGQ